MPLVLVALLAVFAAQAGATNLIQNGDFQSGDFSGWTIGTTSGGTWGQGFPVVTGWPLGGMNAAEGEVGNVNVTGTQQGGTLSQIFTSGAGAATLSFDYAAMGDGVNQNADGGDFTLLLDGVVLNSIDVGTISPTQIINGVLSANANLTAGTHTLEIEVTRQYLSSFQDTPYQYVTGVDVEGTVPEPGSLILMGSGVLGLAGVLRRKIGF
jgi:PEP-CTERM motif